jgi:hypothetical protein
MEVAGRLAKGEKAKEVVGTHLTYRLHKMLLQMELLGGLEPILLYNVLPVRVQLRIP